MLNNRRALYRMLEPYNAHILSAHEHYNENYSPEPHLFEHVHAPLSTDVYKRQASTGASLPADGATISR